MAEALARQHARTTPRYKVAYEDLQAAAYEGLLHALDHSDPTRRTGDGPLDQGFRRYASRCIYGFLMTEIATNDPLNRNLADQVRHYRHGADQLAQPLGRTPTYEERRAALGVRDERRLQALEAWADYQVNQESGHYGTVFPDWDEDLEDWGVTQAVAYAAGRSPRAANPPYEVTVFTLFQEQLQAALAPLPPLEQQVIRVHYYLEESLPQIAREVGLSRQTISHRHQQALASLYQILMERGYGPDSLPDHWAGAFF